MCEWSPVSPWPGPSNENVAIPRSMNTCSQLKNSSFAESRPGSSSTSGGFATSRGFRRFPAIVYPSNGISIRSAVGSSRRCASEIAAIARSCASSYRDMSIVHTNFAKWYESAARTHASPAVSVRRTSSALRASSACMSPLSTHAGSHSSQRSRDAVTARKSFMSTPWELNRGPQCAIAAPTRSSCAGARRCTGHHLLGMVAEILEQDDRAVAAGRAGDRAAGMRGGAGLVEAGDRHPVLCPPRCRAPQAVVRVASVAAVDRAVPHVLVQALDVDRGLDPLGEDHVARHVRRSPQKCLVVLLRDGVLQRVVPRAL